MAELDLAGIITRVCEDLKIKFSKVSFTSTRNTPNTVAFITVDGVTHGICAPAASTDTPLMDGTASYGTSNNYYARADHVHPTDTTRADASAIENATFSSGIISTWITPRATLLATLNSLNSEKQAKLVSGTNIKTINGASILGSGDITTPTYTLPTASTSTLGGVKVDGSTITITDGVISSSGGGGGGSELTLYTDKNFTNLWIDAAKTTTLFESFEYDYHVAKAEMSKFSAIKIWNNSLSVVYFVSRWKVDTIDDTFEVYFSVDVSVVISNKTYRLLQVQKISPS